MTDGLVELNGKPVPLGARTKIIALRDMETTLGHLPPESWAIPELNRRMTDPQFTMHANQMEQKTELLFGDICDDLSDLEFTPAEIAKIINSWLHYEGGPKYCDESEVTDALAY